MPTWVRRGARNGLALGLVLLVAGPAAALSFAVCVDTSRTPPVWLEQYYCELEVGQGPALPRPDVSAAQGDGRLEVCLPSGPALIGFEEYVVCKVQSVKSGESCPVP